jgi:hypothetical protein
MSHDDAKGEKIHEVVGYLASVDFTARKAS